jgi:hypothetical protein
MRELPSIVLVLLGSAAFGLAFAYRQRLQANGSIAWAAGGAIVLLGLFLAFSRDPNAYFLPFMIPFCLAVFPKVGQKVFISLGLLSIFVLAALSAGRANRWEFSLGNVLYQRIIPNSELRGLFQREYHFPKDEVVMPCAKLWFQNPCSGKKAIASWINRNGLRAYREFLLKHPRYVFGEWIKAWNFQQQNLWTLERRPGYYAGKRIRGKRLNNFLFNFPGMVSFPLAVLLVVFGILFLRRNPLILYGLAYSAVVGLIAFHGDVEAVPRHAQQPMMALKLSLVLALLHIYSLIMENDHLPTESTPSSDQAEDQ